MDRCDAGCRYSGADDLVVRLPNAYFLTKETTRLQVEQLSMSTHATGNSTGLLYVLTGSQKFLQSVTYSGLGTVCILTSDPFSVQFMCSCTKFIWQEGHVQLFRVRNYRFGCNEVKH
jgi:hypothetical protein